MQLKNIFVQGTMNKDHDERLVQPNQYIHAENLQVIKSEGSDVGAVENMLGNRALTSIDYGPNAECIGGVADESLELLYWCVVSDRGSYIMEWDNRAQIVSTVLEDTRSEGDRVLDLKKANLITGMNIVIDSDNGKTFLLITDGNLQPMSFNVSRAKTYGPNNFEEEDLLLIKRPPLFAPKLAANEAQPEKENNLMDKFITFSHRYKYLDGEYSALSPFTEAVFHPKDFNFDYATNSNEGMINSLGEAVLTFNTGDKRVTDIEVVFKEHGSNNVYLVEAFNKAKKGWGDSQEVSTTFSNNKVTKILPEDELFRLYDNVPLSAKAQEIIGNRLIYGNYKENYDMTDGSGDPVKADITLTKRSLPIVENKATKTAKSNRDYEAGVAYIDDYGRMTTVMAGGDNTVHVPISDCVNKNQLEVQINSNPPAFAKYYRLFVKQNKENYDTIVANIFYKEGVHVWVPVGPNDLSKFKEGDYLVVKSDTAGAVSQYIETRVVEVRDQPKNFLETEEEKKEGPIRQKAGMYYKLKPQGFRMEESDLDRHESKVTEMGSRQSYGPYVEYPSYYGYNGLDDLQSGGNYTGAEDRRYIIEIDSTGDTDTFRWSQDNGMNFVEEVVITGAAQTLSDGVQITFGSVTGHSRQDRWVVPAKPKNNGLSDTAKTYVGMKSIDGDTIEGGARISIYVKEEGEDARTYEEEFISSRRYDNLEEWFYGDGIDKKFEGKFNKYWFRRGVTAEIPEGLPTGFFKPAWYQTGRDEGNIFLIIRSSGTDNNMFQSNPDMEATLMITQTSTNICFETKEQAVSSDIYYEQSETFPIINGQHASSGRHILPFFNAFAWGNGFESYKVKDDITAKALGIDTRPLGAIEGYRQNHRISSLTYSGVYEQSTNYNALNVFNLSTANYKDLEDGYGSIQKLYTRDNNLLVLQEDKASQVLFGKSVLYNADGSSNVQKTTEVLGDQIPYAGEFGIGTNPESFVAYSTWISWTDAVRGKVIKLGGNGLYPISKQGMNAYFRDAFRNGKNIKNIGAYDPYLDKVLYSVNGSNVVAYDEDVQGSTGGWTGFYTFIPEMMFRLGSRLFSTKNGQLYLHNDKTVPRMNFYGVQYTSKISFASNQSPSDIKVWKAAGIEGNMPWDLKIRTYISGNESFSESTIAKDEFVKKEGYWYAHFRRNELEEDTSGKATYGIGVVESRIGYTITVPNTSGVTAGDKIYTEADELVGTVERAEDHKIIVDTPVLDIAGQYIYGVKDSRVEGAELRGYTSVIEMENDSTDKLELFAFNSEVFKSHR